MAQTNNPSAPEVVALALGEFKRLASEDVASDELASRAAHLIGAYGRSLETTAGLAARLAELAIHDIDLGEISRVVGRIEAVTPQDMRRYAAQHWPLEAARVIVAGDAKLFGSALAQQGAGGALALIPIAELDLEQPSLRR